VCSQYSCQVREHVGTDFTTHIPYSPTFSEAQTKHGCAGNLKSLKDHFPCPLNIHSSCEVQTGASHRKYCCFAVLKPTPQYTKEGNAWICQSTGNVKERINSWTTLSVLTKNTLICFITSSQHYSHIWYEHK
jgi:hypothetical protein